MGTAIKKNQAAMQPQPLAAGKHAASTSGDLEFLIQRQNEFKQAALICKQKGDIERAKKYLTDAKVGIFLKFAIFERTLARIYFSEGSLAKFHSIVTENHTRTNIIRGKSFWGNKLAFLCWEKDIFSGIRSDDSSGQSRASRLDQTDPDSPSAPDFFRGFAAQNCHFSQNWNCCTGSWK